VFGYLFIGITVSKLILVSRKEQLMESLSQAVCCASHGDIDLEVVLRYGLDYYQVSKLNVE